MSILSPRPLHSALPPHTSPQHSRKRRALDSPSHDPVRPSSCIRTLKRVRPHAAPSQPSWVLDRDSSLRVSTRFTGGCSTVDIHFPCGTVYQSHSLFDGPRIFGSEEGFTVLCFLGFGGEETVKAVDAVKGLLEGLGAKCYGVSMTPPERGCGLTILHDRQRTLATRLGLLHPLGGGRVALDAVVVLDTDSRARMVLPIGWGARPTHGGCVDESGNRWENVVGRLVRGIEWLRAEAERGVEVEMVM